MLMKTVKPLLHYTKKYIIFAHGKVRIISTPWQKLDFIKQFVIQIRDGSCYILRFLQYLHFFCMQNVSLDVPVTEGKSFG